MNRSKPMRRTELPKMSASRLAEWEALGIRPTSTFKPTTPKMATTKRQAHTGPKKTVTELVAARSGGICEWPDCGQPQIDTHHRLNRKSGGRHGEAKERVNGCAWLLGACRVHHAYVTSPYGHRRKVARDRGWLLIEHEDATQVPVWTRHSDEPVFLKPEGGEGGWVTYEEAGA